MKFDTGLDFYVLFLIIIKCIFAAAALGHLVLAHTDSYFDKYGNEICDIDVSQNITLVARVQTYTKLERLIFGFGIKDRLGQVVYGTNTSLSSQPVTKIQENSTYVFKVNFDANLGPGSYSIQTSLTNSVDYFDHCYEWRDIAHIFEIINIKKPYFAGCVFLSPQITINKL